MPKTKYEPEVDDLIKMKEEEEGNGRESQGKRVRGGGLLQHKKAHKRK